jgi:magnesium-transporting ATPase (P-type)
VINQFAKNRLRSIAFAYKDFTHDQWEDIRPDLLENKDRKKSLFSELKLISIFAMEDELRCDVVQAIKLAKKGSIDVCIVSGDQQETVNAFAIQAGLIKDLDEHGDPKKKYESITAKEFRHNGGSFYAGTQNL